MAERRANRNYIRHLETIEELLENGAGGGGTPYAVKYTAQSLSSSEQAQARTNIGAAASSALSGKQDTLVSGTNIKTVGGQSLLGSGNVTVNDTSAVKFDAAQSLTTEQRQQARQNIGAISADEMTNMEYVTAAIRPEASENTMGKIYMIGPDANDEYERYFTQEVGGVYSWVPLGSTEIDLSGYATDDEVAQLELEVDDLDEQINGGTVETYEEKQLTPNKKWATQNNPIGYVAEDSVGRYCVQIAVTPGEKYKIYGLGGNSYVLLYVTANSTRYQVRQAAENENCRVTPKELTIQEGEAYLFVNLASYDAATDKVLKVIETQMPGLEDRVQDLEDSMPEVTSVTGTSEELAASQKLVTDLTTSINEQLQQDSEKLEELDEDINGSTVESEVEQTLTPDKRWATQNNPIDYTPETSSTGTYCVQIAVTPGEKYIIYGKGGNQYTLLYVTANSTRYKVRWAEENENCRVTPKEITIQEGESYLFVNLTSYDSNTDKVVKVVETHIPGLEDRVTTLEEREVVESIDVDLPDTINAVVGDTLQLYYKSIFRCVNPYIYDIKVTCNIGSQYPRYFEVTPTIDQIGNHSISFVIKDNNNNILGTKTVNLKVVSKSVNPGTKNILCVGASNTVGGEWPGELKKRLTTAAGTPTVKDGVTLFTPIGFSIPNLTFVGRKTANGVNLEATGGYNFNSYISANVAYVRFYFTQEQAPSVNIGDTYTDGTTVFTVEEINIPDANQLGGYYGNINFTVSSLPGSVGLNLTRVSGSGDASITASAYSMSGNPFVNDGAIDIEHYADTYCNGQIDIVYTECFGNGLVYQYQNDFTETFAAMQSFIDMFLAEFPNCKFCINIMQNKDEKGGLGVNYGAGTTPYAYPYGLKFGCQNLLTELQKYITENNLESTVFIVNTLNEFDCENDYRQTMKQVNPRSGVEEIFGVNGAHPANIGYYQMADAAVRTFIAAFCQS